MAKILHGAGVGDARGSVGGVTFSKSRNGAILRTKVSPVQPRSSSVLTIRAQFASLSTRWANTLTDVQRLGWSALAAVTNYSNVFGNTYHPTGLQLYLGCNRNLDVVSVAHIDDPPANLDVGGLVTLSANAAAPSHAVLTAVDASLSSATYAYSSHTGLTPAVGMSVTVAGFTTPGNNVTGPIIAASGGASGSFALALTTQADETHAGTADGTGFSIGFTDTPLGADDHIVIYATPQQSAGRTFMSGSAKVVQVGAAASASPVNVTSAYAALYGSFRSGTKIQVKAAVIRDSNGAASTPISVTTTVA
jgi:hypothetical protein